jgi:sugar phosphate isomerase/epimerase
MMDRRQFFSAAAVATVASSCATKAMSAPAAAPHDLQEIPFVGLAVATICADGFGNQHHKPAFELLPQAGFRDVEFNLWYADQLTPRYLDGLVMRCAEAQLRPVCVQGTAFGGEGRDGIIKDVSHKLWLIEAAKRLGCRRVKCTGSKRGTNGGLKSVIEVCQELAPAAEESGVLLLLENHTANVLENIADYDAIFSNIDSPNIGLCLDTGHFEGAGIALKEVVERFHTRTQHVDLKDCKEFGKGHNTVVFGQGVTDFDAFLGDLLGRGYSGYMAVEMAWAEPKQPLLENLTKARERFEKYVRS